MSLSSGTPVAPCIPAGTRPHVKEAAQFPRLHDLLRRQRSIHIRASRRPVRSPSAKPVGAGGQVGEPGGHQRVVRQGGPGRLPGGRAAGGLIVGGG